MFMMMMIG